MISIVQTMKLKPLFSLVTTSKDIRRTIALATTDTVSSETNVKPWSEIPGPPSLPIIGQLHHFLPGGCLGDLSDPQSFTSLTKTYGPIIKLEGVFGKPPLLFISDPETIAHVVRSENLNPYRQALPSLEYYRHNVKKTPGSRFTGVATDQGEVWKELRSIVNPVMLQPKTIKLYSAELDEIALEFIARLKANRDGKNMFTNELNEELCMWSLENIGVFALGTRLNCLADNLPKDSPQWQLIYGARQLFNLNTKLDVRPSLWRWFPTPTYLKAMKLYKRQEELSKYFIEKGKLQLKKKSGSEKSFLEKFLEVDEEIALVMASDLFFGGVDTTTNTVLGFMYLLASNPEKQEKLREEVLSKSEQRTYMKVCIKESLRTLPIALGFSRRTTKEYNLLGYRVPKDVDIFFQSRETAMSMENFPRANEFIPERWLVNKDHPLYYGNSHPFAYTPFGYGFRSCIGRRIAEFQFITIISKLLENFRLEWRGPPPKQTVESLIYIRGPYNFIYHDL